MTTTKNCTGRKVAKRKKNDERKKMNQTSPPQHSTQVISHLPVFSLPPSGINIDGAHIHYLSPILPFLSKSKWKMRGEMMAGVQYSLDSITPFQSALTTPFFLFIHHSLPLNYPSHSHLPPPSFPTKAACLDWPETNGRE